MPLRFSEGVLGPHLLLEHLGTFVFLAPPLQMSCRRHCLFVIYSVYFYNIGILQIQQGKDLFYSGSWGASVASFTLLFSSSHQVVVFEKEQEEVCQLYALINRNSVPISSEDQIAFTQLEPSVTLLRTLIGDALAVRDSTVEEFLTSLSRDATGLSCKLEELKPKLLVNENSLKFLGFFKFF